MDLGYLNSRIRAWRGSLLDKEDYDSLIGARDIHGMVNYLKDGAYARDMEISAARNTNETDVIEGAIKGNLTRTFKNLWEYAPDEAGVLLKVIFSVWEVYNLKAVLRAKSKGVSPAESMTVLMPSGDMDESALKELNQQKDIFELANLLSTWGSPYAKPVKEGIRQYTRERHLAGIELGLDRFIHDYCLSVAMAAGGINGEIIKRFVRERIDSINISTLIKLSGDGILPANISDYFLEGGEVLDKDRFLMLAISKDTRVLLEGLANAVKDSRWKDAIISLESENIF